MAMDKTTPGRKRRGYPLPNLRAWRLAINASQVGLAKAAGMHQRRISSYEQGKQWADLRTVDRLADALGIARDLLMLEDHPSRKPAQLERARQHWIISQPREGRDGN
jgi:transcriptional regulator with XRE-family HTH domain